MRPEVGLELIDAPIPVAGPEDVLIRVHRTAVCGTDIHIWNWDEWSQKNVPTPMITGHEFSGEIVAIGSEVNRPLKIGQRVSAEGHVIDLNSEAARAGHFHLDPHTRGIGVNRQGGRAVAGEVGREGIEFRGRRRQTGENKRQATQQGLRIGVGRGREALRLHFREEKAVHRMRRPGAVRDRGRHLVFHGLERPPCFPRGEKFAPRGFRRGFCGC
eukprot:gene38604-50701_t